MNVQPRSFEITMSYEEAQRLHDLVHDGTATVPWTDEAKAEVVEMRRALCRAMDCDTLRRTT